MDTDFRAAMDPAERLLAQFVDYIPTLAAALLLALVGIFFAIGAQRFTRWAIRKSGLESFAERLGVSRPLYALGYHASISRLGGSLVLWLGLLLTLLISSEAAGLEGFALGVAAVVAWLPSLGAACAILAIGLYVSDLAGRIVGRIATGRGVVKSPEIIAAIIRYAVIAITFTIALGQIGLETSLLGAMILVILAASTFGLALSISLGLKGMLSNIVARHYVRQLLRPGDKLRLGDDVSGTVTALGPVTVTLVSDREQVIIPYTLMMSQVLRVDLALQEQPETSPKAKT